MVSFEIFSLIIFVITIVVLVFDCWLMSHWNRPKGEIIMTLELFILLALGFAFLTCLFLVGLTLLGKI